MVTGLLPSSVPVEGAADKNRMRLDTAPSVPLDLPATDGHLSSPGPPSGRLAHDHPVGLGMPRPSASLRSILEGVALSIQLDLVVKPVSKGQLAAPTVPQGWYGSCESPLMPALSATDPSDGSSSRLTQGDSPDCSAHSGPIRGSEDQQLR
jgi:hypothetical protein